MNKTIEEEFVHLFCSSKVRDRLLFELSSKSKRRNALSRFSHNYNNVLIDEYMFHEYDSKLTDFAIATSIGLNEIFISQKQHSQND